MANAISIFKSDKEENPENCRLVSLTDYVQHDAEIILEGISGYEGQEVIVSRGIMLDQPDSL